tara:strand:- start:2962 stop:3201 length:240 start_codon:yes stop_codon:yes gene_type:complete
MKCKFHPNAEIYFQEVTNTAIHPFSGKESRITQDVPVCTECFEEYTETGTYRFTEKNINKQLNKIHSDVDEWIDSQINS